MRTQSKAGIRLEKIPEKTGSPTKGASMAGTQFQGSSTKMTMQMQDGDIPVLKNIKLTDDEKTFIKDYRKLEELEREKEIKFF